MRVLILRPEPGNAATAAAVVALGHEPVRVPLFDVRSIAWLPPEPEDFDAVVLTSANAARYGGPGLGHYMGLPLFAVGPATAHAARVAGFTRVTVGDGDASDVAALIEGQRVLHLAGSDVVPVPGAMRINVYAANLRILTAAEAAALAAPLALIHSPRAGGCFAALSPDRSTTTIVAISEAAASACGTGWSRVAVAAMPREAAMLETLAGLFDSQTRAS